MSDELTPRRGIESFRKEAKRWLKLLRDGDADARARLARAIPNPPTDLTLRDVQFALAREHGFAGWEALADSVERARAATTQAIVHYEAAARALLDAYRTGTPDAMERHYSFTWHRRAWQAMRTYVQLDLGKRPNRAGDDVEITLDDARYLVAREHGFVDWSALVRGQQRAPHIADAHMTDEKLAKLGASEDLVSLDLHGSPGVTDDGIALLTRFPALRELKLGGTSVTDRGVEVLRHLPALEHVDLSWTRTGDAAIRALAGKEHLRVFRSGHFVTDDGLALLHALPVFKTWHGGDVKFGLTSYEAAPNQLMLRGTFTDRGMQALRGLDGLFALNIDDSALAITPAAMEPLVSLPNLGWLAVDAKDESMPYIAEMPRLRFLGVQDTVAGDDGFVALSKSRTIETIWGRRCHNLRTRGFTALANMPALRALSVSCLNVEDAGIATLPTFPALRELMPMDIPDAGYRHIGRCAQLESLILMYCRDTTDAATEEITGLSNLSYYFNSYTTITDRTPGLLSRMESLERVTFDSCHNLTNAGIAQLACLPRLRELRVSGRRLTADVAQGFGDGVNVQFFL